MHNAPDIEHNVAAAFTLLPHQQETWATRIHALQMRSYQQEADLLDLRPEQFPPLQTRVETVQADAARYFGLVDEQNLLALLALEDGTDSSLISSLVVAPEYQGQGMARRLLREFCRYHPPALLRVCTARANLPAVNLYQRTGFVIQREWEQALPDGQMLAMLELHKAAPLPV